ncbi:hypothetical protein ACJ41O_001805 [Fusarium nematophilum]
MHPPGFVVRIVAAAALLGVGLATPCRPSSSLTLSSASTAVFSSASTETAGSTTTETASSSTADSPTSSTAESSETGTRTSVVLSSTTETASATETASTTTGTGSSSEASSSTETISTTETTSTTETSTETAFTTAESTTASTAEPISTTTTSPPTQPTLSNFFLIAQNSQQQHANGQYFRYGSLTGNPPMYLVPPPNQADDYPIGEFYLEPTTNRLRVANRYVMASAFTGYAPIYSVGPSGMTNSLYVKCDSPVVSGEALRCMVEGTTRTEFTVAKDERNSYEVYLNAPGADPTFKVTFDLIAMARREWQDRRDNNKRNIVRRVGRCLPLVAMGMGLQVAEEHGDDFFDEDYLESMDLLQFWPEELSIEPWSADSDVDDAIFDSDEYAERRVKAGEEDPDRPSKRWLPRQARSESERDAEEVKAAIAARRSRQGVPIASSTDVILHDRDLEKRFFWIAIFAVIAKTAAAVGGAIARTAAGAARGLSKTSIRVAKGRGSKRTRREQHDGARRMADSRRYRRCLLKQDP